MFICDLSFHAALLRHLLGRKMKDMREIKKIEKRSQAYIYVEICNTFFCVWEYVCVTNTKTSTCLLQDTKKPSLPP